MKKNIQITVMAFVALFFVACGFMEKERMAAQKAGAIFGASDVHVQTSAKSSTSEGTYKSLDVELSNLSKVDTSYSREAIASAAAYSVIKELTQKELNGYDRVTIKIDDDGIKSEKYYTTNDLIRAFDLVGVAEKFMFAGKNSNDDLMRQLVSPQYISDASVGYITHYTDSTFAANGSEFSYFLTGFMYDQMTGDNPVPVLGVVFEAKNGK
ncbi:MAG: hypothetical protein ACRCYO_02745, partial [Bacteroidia bacterium]